MSIGVQFEGDWRPPAEEPKKKSVLVRLAMRLGAKDEKQANIFLVIASVIFFLAAIFVSFL